MTTILMAFATAACAIPEPSGKAPWFATLRQVQDAANAPIPLTVCIGQRKPPGAVIYLDDEIAAQDATA
ncbi:hypothetical protein [Streptomyces sp. CB02959]|uniref:hypothetical protein n=1 Tax=Streptomyces sp. CB02959 TaxID=2020330 RepID=UPI0011AFA73D|nr:hypothetical protein [Streptomyces sp. CB02959]